MKKYLSVLFLIVFIAPSIALASWWNPLSWNIFSFLHKKEVAPQIQKIEEKTQEEKINDLQKQLNDLKNTKPKTNTSQIITPTSSKILLSSLYEKYKTENIPSSKSASSVRYLSDSTILYSITVIQHNETNMKYIKSLDKGTEVIFMNDVHKDWSKISVGGQIGWVFSNKLIKGEPSTPKLSDVIKKWRPIVAYIECDFRDTNTSKLYSQVSGSGVVIDFGDGQITVITNKHVIADSSGYQPSVCRVKLPDDNNIFTVQGKDISGYKTIDIGLININNPNKYIKDLTSISVSPLKLCKQKPSVGESILILGYPGIGSQTDVTATEGIISGYDESYFITSAKIEHGNSGGIAVLLKSDCYLGIPTGVVAGELESLGRILDINNLLGKLQ